MGGEGPQQICCEDGMYEKLGLKEDDEKEKKARDEGDRSARSVLPIDMSDELVCGDNLPNEMVGFCDWRNPVMDLESRYKDMATFRLAIRQFAIKEEFELGIEATSPIKFRAYCKGGDGEGGDCPWRIHARAEIKGSPTIIVCFVNARVTFYVVLFPLLMSFHLFCFR
jgi:hypothetical protein